MESDFLNQMPQLLFILLFIFESKQHPGSILNTVKHFFLPFFFCITVYGLTFLADSSRYMAAF